MCNYPGDPGGVLFNGRPLIFVEESMAHYGLRRGLLLYPIPTVDNIGTTLSELVEPLDGLILHGGADMCPRTYGQEPLRSEWTGDEARDHYELALVRACIEQDRPILGICRGIQVINVFFGGTLFQDIVHCQASKRIHRDAKLYEKNEHDMAIIPGSFLESLYPGVTSARINSVHHQAIDKLGQGLEVAARSLDDHIIEAVRLTPEKDHAPYCVGVQWHPEFQTSNDTHLLPPEPIVDDFANAAFEKRCQREKGS